MDAKYFCRIGLLLFVVLSVVDLIQTWLLVDQGGGRVVEGNPVAGAWLADFGWRGLALFKAATMLALAGLVVIIARKRPKTAALVVAFACVAVGVVALYGRHLLHHPPPPPEREPLPPDFGEPIRPRQKDAQLPPHHSHRWLTVFSEKPFPRCPPGRIIDPVQFSTRHAEVTRSSPTLRRGDRHRLSGCIAVGA
jgi:hypothetical protein